MLLKKIMERINITQVKKQFKVYSPLTAKSVDDFIAKSDGDRILLEGVASTTNRDLDDEVVSKTAIKSMVNQAPLLNLHGDHKYGLGDVIGAIKKAIDAGDEMRIQFLTTKKYTPLIRDLLETGVNLGLSIGGFVTKYDEVTKTINDINLNEITLTPMPANWDTYGTVQFSKDGVDMVKSNCLSGACHAIIKSLNKEEEARSPIEADFDADITELSEDEVFKLVNEFLTEKQAEITDEIVNKVSSQLETMVDTKIKQLKEELDESKKEEEKVEPPKPEEEKEKPPKPEEEDAEKEPTEKDDDDDKAEKTVDVSNLIAESVSKALSDDAFVDKLAIKMFGELDKSRGNTGSKFDEYMKEMKKDQGGKEKEETTVKKTFTSKEASDILLKKQRISDPLTKAINQQLE